MSSSKSISIPHDVLTWKKTLDRCQPIYEADSRVNGNSIAAHLTENGICEQRVKLMLSFLDNLSCFARQPNYSEWMCEYFSLVYSFILQNPQGTKEACAAAFDYAVDLSKDHGILSLEIFYDELLKAGYSARGIRKIKKLLDGVIYGD